MISLALCWCALLLSTTLAHTVSFGTTDDSHHPDSRNSKFQPNKTEEQEILSSDQKLVQVHSKDSERISMTVDSPDTVLTTEQTNNQIIVKNVKRALVTLGELATVDLDRASALATRHHCCDYRIIDNVPRDCCCPDKRSTWFSVILSFFDIYVERRWNSAKGFEKIWGKLSESRQQAVAGFCKKRVVKYFLEAPSFTLCDDTVAWQAFTVLGDFCDWVRTK